MLCLSLPAQLAPALVSFALYCSAFSLCFPSQACAGCLLGQWGAGTLHGSRLSQRSLITLRVVIGFSVRRNQVQLRHVERPPVV